MKTMMKKTTQYWGVSTKFFDSGKVKANIFPVEVATKPESMTEENRERVRAYVAQLIAAQGVPEAEKIVSDI